MRPLGNFKIPAELFFFPAPDVDSACVVLVRAARSPLFAIGGPREVERLVKLSFSAA